VAGANPLTCESTDDIRFALQIMRDAKTRYLAVVDGDGVLDGMVSIEDIILSVQRGDGKAGPAVTYSDVATTLKAICNRAGDGAVSAHPDGP
jgi:CBS domain-containing protein